MWAPRIDKAKDTVLCHLEKGSPPLFGGAWLMEPAAARLVCLFELQGHQWLQPCRQGHAGNEMAALYSAVSPGK